MLDRNHTFKTLSSLDFNVTMLKHTFFDFAGSGMVHVCGKSAILSAKYLDIKRHGVNEILVTLAMHGKDIDEG